MALLWSFNLSASRFSIFSCIYCLCNFVNFYYPCLSAYSSAYFCKFLLWILATSPNSQAFSLLIFELVAMFVVYLWSPTSCLLLYMLNFSLFAYLSLFLTHLLLHNSSPHWSKHCGWAVLPKLSKSSLLSLSVWSLAFDKPRHPTLCLSVSWSCWGLFDKSYDAFLFAHSQQSTE